MAEKKTSLKAKNLKYVALVLVIDLALIWTLVFHGDFKAIVEGATAWEDRLAKAAFGSSALTLAGIALSYLVPSEWKAVLVFWRTKDVLPGCRAFSHLMPKDPRVDRASIEKQVGKLPTEPNEQNAAWYRLLKKHEGDSEVAEPHQYYLLFRDLASISLVAAALAGMAPIARLLPSDGTRPTLLLFAAQYLVCAVIARNSANRMVANVLAIASLAEPAKKSRVARSGGKEQA